MVCIHTLPADVGGGAPGVNPGAPRAHSGAWLAHALRIGRLCPRPTDASASDTAPSAPAPEYGEVKLYPNTVLPGEPAAPAYGEVKLYPNTPGADGQYAMAPQGYMDAGPEYATASNEGLAGAGGPIYATAAGEYVDGWGCCALP